MDLLPVDGSPLQRPPLYLFVKDGRKEPNIHNYKTGFNGVEGLSLVGLDSFQQHTHRQHNIFRTTFRTLLWFLYRTPESLHFLV